MNKVAMAMVIIVTLILIAGCGQPAPVLAPTSDAPITVDPSALVPTEGPYAGSSDPGQIYMLRLMQAAEDARQYKEKTTQEQGGNASSADEMYRQWMEAARAGGWY